MNTNINPDTPEYLPQPHNGKAPPQTEPQTEAFIGKPFSAWLHEAKKKPPITPMFDAFWQRGELAFMFGATGIGKSILAVQIADAISKGMKIQGFDGVQETMKVGLFDFEHSTIQFAIRYRDESGKRHKFSPNFLRAEFKARAAKIPKGMDFQDFFIEETERKIIENGIEVAVIDSLTGLLPSITATNVTKDALEFMRKLRMLKLRQNISMLVTGHTPKRPLGRPITERDIAVSWRIMNFCDSVFAIGESKQKNVRYLKQIKTSSSELKYDDENVAVFRLVKRNCFLGFEHIGFDRESEHLCDFS